MLSYECGGKDEHADAADGTNRPRRRIWELWTVEHQLLDKALFLGLLNVHKPQ